MAKRSGRPPNVPFNQMLGQHQGDYKPKRAAASNRRFGKYMDDMGQHVKDLDEGKLNLNDYGAKRRDTMNAYQTGKPPYAFKPRKDD
jgi:hypothetical protein